jgi:proteic killer suppression protein
LDILFKTEKLSEEWNNQRLLEMRYGQRGAKLLRRRLDELDAAATLADIAKLPGPRCHEHKGDRKDQLAVSLEGGKRLIFEVANDPIHTKER